MTHRTPARTPGLFSLGLTGMCLVASLALAGCWTEPVEPTVPDVDQPTGEGTDDVDLDGIDLGKSGLTGSDGASSSEGNAPGGDSAAAGVGDADGTADAADGSASNDSGEDAEGTTSANRGAASGNSGSSSASGNRGSNSTNGNRGSSGSSTASKSGGNRGSSGSSTASKSGGNHGSSTASKSGGNRGTGGDSGTSTASGNRGSSDSSSKNPGGDTQGSSGKSGNPSRIAGTSGLAGQNDTPTEVADVDAARGVTEYTGEDWQQLREARFILDMGEPGPGTNPKCFAKDMAPLAIKGKLTKDAVACIQKALSEAERTSDQAQLSLVLISNAHARNETENWEWLVARHLEIIDEENPGLSYRYAMHLYAKGEESYSESLRWANVALAQRAAWAGEKTYHDRVTRLYKVRAALSQSLWRNAESRWTKEQSDENRDDVLDYREQTRKMALEWYKYAKETNMDLATPYSLCEIASIGEGCEGAGEPPS